MIRRHFSSSSRIITAPLLATTAVAAVSTTTLLPTVRSHSHHLLHQQQSFSSGNQSTVASLISARRFAKTKATKTATATPEAPTTAPTTPAAATPATAETTVAEALKLQQQKQQAEAEMRAKYAPEGQVSAAMGTLTVDEAARLGYVGWRYRAHIIRELLPAVTLPTGLAAFAGAAWFFPEVVLTQYGFAASAAALVFVQRLQLRGKRAEPVDLRGKVCVVTGASSNGIGRQVAAAFVAAGAEVVISHRTTTSHDAVAGVVKAADKKWRHFVPKGTNSTVEDFERRVVAWPLTLEDRLSVVKFASVVRQKFPGGVDYFVQCAGSTPDYGELVMTKNGYEHHIDSNFLGVWQLTEALLPGMKKRGAANSSTGSDSRVVFVVHPGHGVVRGKNIVGEFFAPTKIIDDWRYSNAFQFFISHFGLVCGIFNLVQRGVSAVAVSPGRVASMYRRTIAPTSTTLWKWPLISVIMRTPYEGAQSVVYAATSPAVPKATPCFVSNCTLRDHWKSRTLYDERKCAGVVAWAQMQLKSAASSVSGSGAGSSNKTAGGGSSSADAARKEAVAAAAANYAQTRSPSGEKK